MPKIRVVIVEDSATVRRYLEDVIGADPELILVGKAEDGKQAIELTQQHRPDVVSLDMMLPVMTGLAATEYIMAYCPTPILIVSSSTNRGELFRTYDALAAGAVDVLEKPSELDLEEWALQYRRSLKRVAKIKVVRHPRALIRAHQPASKPRLKPEATASPARYILIGASTGGPSAVREILCGLRKDFELPILVVIHIGEPFGSALAEWLDGVSTLRVQGAVDDMPIPARGGVVIAPHSKHMVVKNGRIRLTDEAERHSCRPSVDVLFESAAAELGPAALAVLLTGMGKDGAQGMLAIRRAGGTTIAQDELSSLIFGMPKAAIELGAAQQVLPLKEIPSLLSGAGFSKKSVMNL